MADYSDYTRHGGIYDDAAASAEKEEKKAAKPAVSDKTTKLFEKVRDKLIKNNPKLANTMLMSTEMMKESIEKNAKMKADDAKSPKPSERDAHTPHSKKKTQQGDA